MLTTSSPFRVSWFRHRGVAWIVLTFLLWSFLPSLSLAQQSGETLSQEELAEIQSLLQHLSYDPGPIDGKMGQKTTSAIEAFQMTAELSVDGQPSKTLLAALYRELTLMIGQRAKDGNVKLEDIQFSLQYLGYDPGPVDGKMGQKTTTAITTFQTEQQIRVDGEPTPEILNALHRELVKKIGPTATLSEINGTVLVNGQQAQAGAVLIAGDVIETQAEATVELTLSDGSVLTLEEQTRVEFAELSQAIIGARISSLKLPAGRIRVLLSQEHQKEGSAFTVETPNARIDATFSEPDIEVIYNQERLETVGIAHQVKLMAKNLATDEEVLVPVGFTVIITNEATKVIAGIILSGEELEKEPEPEEIIPPISPVVTPEIEEITTSETKPDGAEEPSEGFLGNLGTGKTIAIGAGALALIGGVVVLAGGGSGGGDSGPTSCENIAGNWWGTETVNITCTIRGIPDEGDVTDSFTQRGRGDMFFEQNGCRISYDMPIDTSLIVTPVSGSSTRRTGTIDERNIRMSGSFLLGFTEPLGCTLSVTENRITATGTVSETLDTMNLNGSGIFTGSCMDAGVTVTFSCTGNSTANMSR